VELRGSPAVDVISVGSRQPVNLDVVMGFVLHSDVGAAA
jgi:hypothetical protein